MGSQCPRAVWGASVLSQFGERGGGAGKDETELFKLRKWQIDMYWFRLWQTRRSMHVVTVLHFAGAERKVVKINLVGRPSPTPR